MRSKADETFVRVETFLLVFFTCVLNLLLVFVSFFSFLLNVA